MIKSHAHPYFVIVNALPKLSAHSSVLTPQQKVLLLSMKLIVNRWRVIPDPLHPSGLKRPRGDDSDDEDGGDAGGPRGGPCKRKNPRRGINPEGNGQSGSKAGRLTSTKGKGKQVKLDLSGPPLQDSYPNPPWSAKTTNVDLFHYDNKAHILAWIDTVIAAGPLEQVPNDVIKPNGEHAHPPFNGNWHTWCYPYVQPADESTFCSSDWAMHIYMCKLTMSPGCWEFSDSDFSDSEDVILSLAHTSN